MRMFLRRSTLGREQLAVTMTSVGQGERALQIGVNDPIIAAALAAKPGLTGQSTVLVADERAAASARRAVAETGALVDITVTPLETFPLEDGSFDVVVIHNRDGLLAALGAPRPARVLKECRRVVRTGGRVVVLETGAPSGLRARVRTLMGRGRQAAATATTSALEAAGFRAVRTLGDRDNYRFIEGIRA